MQMSLISFALHTGYLKYSALSIYLESELFNGKKLNNQVSFFAGADNSNQQCQTQQELVLQ